MGQMKKNNRHLSILATEIAIFLAVIYSQEVQNVLKLLVNSFAIGRSSIKVYLFVLLLIFLRRIYYARFTARKNIWRAHLVLLFSLFSLGVGEFYYLSSKIFGSSLWMWKANLFIYSSGKPRIDDTVFEVVERKGIGHPDTLCDTIAEKVSQAYSQYCLRRYGTILRHMVDKIALSGGATKVKFGGGEIQKPIKLYLNCRFTRTYQQETIPYLKIVKDTVYKHFGDVLPLLNLDQWLRIVDNTHFAPGPGIVYDADESTQNERQFFFEIPQKEFVIFHDNSLRSNDTSTTVAYSPLSATEQIVILVETMLNGKEFKKLHPCVGTDIKVMAKRIKKRMDITVCIPFIAAHTPSKEFYFENIGTVNYWKRTLRCC